MFGNWCLGFGVYEPTEEVSYMDVQIGKVTHYYDKIGVAIIEVANQVLKVGDSVKISGHDNEFNQKVTSLQVEHEQVSELGPGDSGGLKVQKAVKEGDVVYLLTK